jgi:hypothetical protein
MLAVTEKFAMLNPAVLSEIDEFTLMQEAKKLQEDQAYTPDRYTCHWRFQFS